MLKSSDISVKKCPWIPPPAKTTKSKSLLPTKNVSQHLNLCLSGSNETKHNDVDGPSEIGSSKFAAGFEPAATSSGTDFNAEGQNIASFDNVKIQTPSSSASLINENCSGFPFLQLQAFKQELRLLKLHCSSLNSSSQLVHRSVQILGTKGYVLNEHILKADNSIKAFIESFEDAERSLSSLEISGKDSSGRLDEYLCANRSKEHLLAKLLEAYESISSVLKRVLENQEAADFSPLNNEQEAFKRTLEDLKERFWSCEAHVQDLERQLATSQDQIYSLQRLNSSLEETRANMQRQLVHKESQIEHFRTQLLKAQSNRGISEGNESLIEIMEELNNKAKAEKEALKKALRVQRNRADQSEEIISNLKVKLDDKEQAMFNITTDRDQWKTQLTVLTNKLLESENQMQDLKMNNLKLQAQLSEGEASHKAELFNVRSTINDKSGLLEEISKGNYKLREAQSSLEERCMNAESELKCLQQKYETLKEEFYTQTENVKKQSEAETESGKLVILLQDIKEHLCTVKDTNHTPQNESIRKGPVIEEFEYDAKNLSTLAQEIKEQLIQAKEAYRQFLEKNSQVEVLEKDLHELKEKYDSAVEEQQLLQTQLQEMEKKNSFIQQTNLSRKSGGDFFGNIQEQHWVQLTDKAASPSLPCYEQEKRVNMLQKQVEELRDQIDRQESSNSIRIMSLEEELNRRKTELSTVEKKRYDDEERLLTKIKDLQENLDRTTMSYDSLQKYVHVLKSSYVNVFGVP